MVHSEVYWHIQGKREDLPPLSGDTHADVVIVGGGMAGLMCAQALLNTGKRVVILEKEFCGSGASGKSSGFITPDSEIDLSSLIRMHGPATAKKIWEFVLSGVADIRQTIQDHQFSCDYQVQDSFFIANSESRAEYPREEHESRMQLGYRSRFYGKKELPAVIESDSYAAGVRYPDTFGINAYLYCQSLKQTLVQRGAMIYEQTPVTGIFADGARTARGTAFAPQTIVCADRFIPDFGIFKKEIYHVQTFLGISQPLSQEQAHMIFPEQPMMVWDTDLVYNYFRVTGDNRLLIGGGDVFYTYARKQTANVERFARRLKNYIDAKFPNVPIEIEYLWPGMLGVSKDLLPIMGSDSKMPNVWYVGAAAGLPWAAALGRYAADRLLNGRTEFDAVFSPHRKFVIGRKVQAIIGTPPAFALSHGLALYS